MISTSTLYNNIFATQNHSVEWKITINGVDITVAATSVDYTVIIDTDLGEAYRTNGASVNNLISIPGNEFPKLVPGNNTVKFTRGSSSSLAYARIIPNWWRI